MQNNSRDRLCVPFKNSISYKVEWPLGQHGCFLLSVATTLILSTNRNPKGKQNSISNVNPKYLVVCCSRGQCNSFSLARDFQRGVLGQYWVSSWERVANLNENGKNLTNKRRGARMKKQKLWIRSTVRHVSYSSFPLRHRSSSLAISNPQCMAICI